MVESTATLSLRPRRRDSPLDEREALSALIWDVMLIVETILVQNKKTRTTLLRQSGDQYRRQDLTISRQHGNVPFRPGFSLGGHLQDSERCTQTDQNLSLVTCSLLGLAKSRKLETQINKSSVLFIIKLGFGTKLILQLMYS